MVARHDPRPYQATLIGDARTVLAAGGDPLVVLPTGGGKTFLFARVMSEHGGPSIAIAHRKELVAQISIALGRDGVRHRIIAPDSTIAYVVRRHIAILGRSFYQPNAPVAVAGVDSLKRVDVRYAETVTLAVFDEAHHVLRSNKWGAAADKFPHARCLGVTATPERADGKGLGKHASGIFTHLLSGPTMRELIEAGYLTDFQIYSPPNSLDMSAVRVTAGGDYSRKAMSSAVQKAQITGDVVEHYKRLALGRLGVTFVVDIDAAKEVAAAFRAAGVPALAVHSKMSAADRDDALAKFELRELWQLVNVDLFGEGFDMPAIEVVSFVRPTKSWGLLVQQFGRALRILAGKTVALIIDHVGNIVVTHRRLPDGPQTYSLDARARRSSTSERVARLTTCPGCMGTYERVLYACPQCGCVPEPVERSAPVYVDGDLVMLTSEALDALRAPVDAIDRTPDEYRASLAPGVAPLHALAHVKRHRANQSAQAQLRALAEWWAGVQVARGLDERQAQRLFYLDFGVDALSARGLRAVEADALRERIYDTLPDYVREQATP